MKQKLTVEERLKASGYNLDKGYVPPKYNDRYIKGWNDAINRAIDKLSNSPGGTTRYTVEKLEELKK